MKYMHTKLPDFYSKLVASAKQLNPDTEIEITGLESYKSAKLASLRCGRIEEEIMEVVEDPSVMKVEIIMVPNNPEVTFNSVVKGYRADGSCTKAVIDYLAVSGPTLEYHLIDAEEIVDRRTSRPQY